MSTVGNIKNMHYDFKQRLNIIDSNTYIGLKIPEIDRALNRALNLYILLVAEPRLRNQLGVDVKQRTIDDIRPLIVNDVTLALDVTKTIAALPEEYLYYLSTEEVLATKGICANKSLETFVIQHDDKNNLSPFHKSDFEWGECNIRFFDGGIKLFPTDFTIDSFKINYIKKHPYMHNAEDFNGATYTLPDGTVLTDSVDCELPDITHNEIVDLAVLLTTGDLELPNSFQFKKQSVQTNQLLQT